jgi:phosphopantothenoylcysteine decarboxylase/phosphopantothenate--cysteine ligase
MIQARAGHKKNKNPKFPGKILVTAGPTIEPLDPVRYISNRSTGAMGYEIAAEGKRRGFEVCLISGPAHLTAPSGVETLNVLTAQEMRDKVIDRIGGYDCVIMAAAVCDFRPERSEKRKIKKRETMMLKLVKNPDILSEIGRKKGLVKVGFALETEDPFENARDKLRAKDLDLIIINTISKGSDPFGTGGARYALLDRNDNIREIGKRTKKQMAGIIMGEVEKLLR